MEKSVPVYCLSIFDTEIKRLCIPYKGRFASSVANAVEVYKTEPSMVLFEKLWRLLWVQWGDPELLNRMEYQIIHRCKMWYVQDNGDLTKTVKTGKTCRSFVIATLKYKVTNNIRKRFMRAELVPHGITLRLSRVPTKGGAKDTKRTPRKCVGVFDPAKHVKGWGELKHKEWAEQRGEEKVVLECLC